jgi:hypothetical protein
VGVTQIICKNLALVSSFAYMSGDGWICKTRLDVGGRLAAACDVPDLELFPARYAGDDVV